MKNIVELSVMLVETNMHAHYFIVYKLLKLVLILPVATASVERVFSSMKYLKNKLRNKMGDEYLNNVWLHSLRENSSAKSIMKMSSKSSNKVIVELHGNIITFSLKRYASMQMICCSIDN